MKKLLAPLLIVVAAVLYGLLDGQTLQIPSAPPPAAAPAAVDDSALRRAIDARADDVQVEGQGTVAKILPDDNKGSRHQRFIVRLAGGETVLIAHNIDLAPRVSPLDAGDTVSFAGEYVWNPQGGVVHWTHHDPRGKHPGGWIRRDGQTFE
ncbi:MAG TPA: DUF3465 domain-containing protein [Fontimonas sp.]